MASRPMFKQQDSFGPTADVYELQPHGGQSTPSIRNGINGDVPIAEEDERRLKGATVNDQNDMNRLGKTQELRRNFRFLSIFGYSLMLANGWVMTVIGLLVPLTNGGSAGAIWSYVLAFIGSAFGCLSMSEMASMAPTAGGQYHWVSEFAPKRHQRFLSFLTGWLSVLGWQTSLVGTAYTAALAIQGLIALNTVDYAVPAWHGVLLTIGIVLITIIFNTVLLRRLPALEGGMLVVHVFGFIAIVVVLWVMGDKTDPGSIFTEFSDPQGWGSYGVAMLVGSVAGTGSTIGSDSSVHLGEELREAAWVLPRSMVTSAAVNYTLAFLMLITLLVTKGSDVEQLIGTPYVQPYVAIFYNATQSIPAASVMTALVFVLLMFGIINQVTTTSRQLWSFARDGGLPFSPFLSRVQPGWDIPINSITVTLAFNILITMIILGSPVAFFTLGTLAGSALYASYLICIGCMVSRRLSGEPLPPSRFNLGKKFGMFCNLMAMCFQSMFFIFMFFPVAPNPDGPNFNWSLAIFGVTVIWAVVYYHLWGKKTYVGPVMYIKRSN
ncbi:hypothetical protein Q7P36_007249 [Cladosporium allicinum]